MNPTERGLWDAILTHPEDDLARLVYADYLEETGRQPLATFLHAQIRLAQAPPGHADYADAVEAQSLALAGVRGASSLPAPTLPDSVIFAGSIRDIDEDMCGWYERGFAHRVTLNGGWSSRIDITQTLQQIHSTTTVRGLNLKGFYLRAEDFAKVLAHPIAPTLTTLGLCQSTIRHSEIMQQVTEATTLGQVLHLVIAEDRTIRDGVIELGRSAWFPGVTRLEFLNSDFLIPLRDAIPPALTALTTNNIEPAGLRTLARLAPRLPQLKELTLRRIPADAAYAEVMARWPLAPLAVFHLSRMEPTAELLAAPYLQNLTELAMRGTPTTLAALLRTDSLRRSLRLLYLEDVAGDDLFGTGQTGRGVLPALTTMRIQAQSKSSPEGFVRFAESWRDERLHTLIVEGWPASNAALQKLAANPAFASLRRLKLARTGVQDAGAVALARSPYLQELVELDLSYNKLGEKSAALFLDSSVMPKLVRADLTTNRMPPDTRTRLRASRVGVWA